MKKLALTIALLFFVTTYSQKKIPNTALITLKGKTVKLHKELQKDNVTILSFWATWCVPCINELDAINEVYEDWKKETNVKIIAVSIDDSRTKRRIKPLVNGKDWNYRILIDKSQELKRALNISLVPYIIVLKGNVIVYKKSGYTPGSEEQLYKIIKKLSK